ncbi:MAG: glycosyltransferase family 39 protein, partial [Desulfatiglandales bacterium]
MNVTDSFCMRNRKWILLLLLLMSYPLFFHKLGDRDIWSPDEDEYVQVNREMVLDGHWIYPTANGQPYNIKPPLFNWLGSSFAKLNGEVTEHTSRLPSALAASAGLLVLYFLGRRLFGHRAGFLSALIIGTTPIYIEFGRWIQINMISTVLLMATLGLFYRGYSDERKRAPAYLLMYVPIGLGTLNMGLVNVVMPMIVIGLYLIAMKDVKHILRLKIGWGILIYLAIVAPWYVAVSLKGGYAHNLIIVTNITRYFEEFAHVRPFFYYLTTTPPYFLPWLIFLPGAFYLCFSQQTKIERKQLLFPFLWVVGLFVFLSISKTKRSEYLLPIFPAMALLVGYAIDRSLRWW